MKRISMFAGVLLGAGVLASGSTLADNWVARPGDLCKSNPVNFKGQLAGLGYSHTLTALFGTKSASHVLCVRKNSTGAYELWQVESSGSSFCRYASRANVGSSCANPLP